VPVLPVSLTVATRTALRHISRALGKFGSGDSVNSPRVLKLVEPAGLALAAVATSLGAQLATARSECVDALIKLLGSDAFRKDEEVALSVGEALATFAEAYDTTDSTAWETATSHWPSEIDLVFASRSPAPVQVRQCDMVGVVVQIISRTDFLLFVVNRLSTLF
jgi:hypothetical protein